MSAVIREIYVIDGARTPFLKVRDRPNPFSASDLAVAAGKALLLRQPFLPSDIEEVVLGCVMPREDEANIARIVALRLGCGDDVPAYTVQRNCASGMQALGSAIQDITEGRYDLVLAGGTEAMSHAPILWNEKLLHWIADWRATDGFSQLKVLARFRPSYLKPIFSLAHGLTDPMIELNMGQTAEELAYEWHISRDQMDKYAFRSHQRLAAAENSGDLPEIIPLYDKEGQCYQHDDGLRRDTNLEKLSQLKPCFDVPFGQVTPGNSAQITDGAALLLLASEKAVKKYQLPVLGRIIATQWAAVSGKDMGLGPVLASSKLLDQNLSLSSIDFWEINEAFASQVLACLRAFDSDVFCRQKLGLEGAMGKIDEDHLNVDGGAIALGHPVGASGARIVLHLLHVLARKQAQKGIATLCIGGGQGGAMLVEK